MVSAWRAALRPPEKLTVSEWADKERRLSPEASAEPGQWLTSRAEFQRGIMDAIADPAIKEIVVMKSAQVGWTEILCNVVGYIIDRDPSPTLMLQPTETMAETWSKDRFAPMLRDTPCLKDKIRDSKSRNSGNTILHKTFPGGHITLVGANAPSGLASRPIRWVLNDEVDRYPVSAGAEGDPISLAKKRTQTFFNAKILTGSTPTIKGASRIELSFEQSDKRYYFVPCPHCGESQRLLWANIKWPEGKPEEAYYVCPHCGVCLFEADKHWMVRHGEWIATAPFKGIAGFHISELYSPWSTWTQMAVDFCRAKVNPHTLQTWINTSLGETWEESGEKMDADSLLARREHYSDILPAGVLLMTAGVDVQDDRLECEVVGWGEGDENWSIDYKVFVGSPALDEVWNELSDYLAQKWRHESGLMMRIASACVDSGGHHTTKVYKFTKKRQHRRIYSVKGSSTPGAPAVSRPTKNNEVGALLFMVGTDTIKEVVYSYLKVVDVGPAYCHFTHHHNDAAYFGQLTAEEVKTRYVKGEPVRYFEHKPGVRNEAIDVRVYATAAKEIIHPNMTKLAELYAMQEGSEPMPEIVDPREEALIEKPPPKGPKHSPVKKPGGFVNRW